MSSKVSDVFEDVRGRVVYAFRLCLARRRVEHKDAAVLQEDSPHLKPFVGEGRELRREEIRPAVIFKTQVHSLVQR